MRQAEHDRIIETAVGTAATHKIVVQDISGVRCHKAVYAVLHLDSIHEFAQPKPRW